MPKHTKTPENLVPLIFRRQHVEFSSESFMSKTPRLNFQQLREEFRHHSVTVVGKSSLRREEEAGVLELVREVRDKEESQKPESGNEIKA
ncbi:hypothetical protein KQX54_008538 [Cotesia glomerata]|uniref:Uncharacterized protein n=1 Tax=Cotesia glomerata TaxID=32391 RepID=A0AAV7J6D1_COTGL|nr:hypothetical protein KQX54_008538 [Cotesia glomerata]